MKLNPNMIDTGRLVFKSKNGEKIVIERKELAKFNLLYLVDFGADSTLVAITKENESLNFKNNILVILSKILIEEDSATFYIYINTNYAIRSLYYIDEYGDIREANMTYVPEPEETSMSYPVAVVFQDLEGIITDPKMFTDLLTDQMIEADEEVLRKFEVNPLEFVSIKGENKPKSNIKREKPKLSIAKKQDS